MLAETDPKLCSLAMFHGNSYFARQMLDHRGEPSDLADLWLLCICKREVWSIVMKRIVDQGVQRQDCQAAIHHHSLPKLMTGSVSSFNQECLHT